MRSVPPPLVALIAAALAVQATGAYAADLPDPPPSVAAVLDDIDDAVADHPAAPVDGALSADLPESGSQPAAATTTMGTLTMDVPATGADLARASDDVAVFDGTAPDTVVALQDTAHGLRALVRIDSTDAPERFDFPIGGDVVDLRLTPDGGVDALGAHGEVIATAPAPWATDANGVAVPTHFEIDGTVLTQVVEHHAGQYAYGIVADPWWNPFSWLDDIWNSVSGVTRATFDSAAKWLGSNATWLANKTWSGVTTVSPYLGKTGKFLVKRYGPGFLVLCAAGGSWAWYRSDANGWTRVGDTVAGCF